MLSVLKPPTSAEGPGDTEPDPSPPSLSKRSHQAAPCTQPGPQR